MTDADGSTVGVSREIDNAAEAVVEIGRARSDVKEQIEHVQPDTSKESRLWGQYNGLGQALDILDDLHDFDLPEWEIGVVNANTDEWEWYNPHATKREDATKKAMEQAKEELGEPLNIYEVYGPHAQ